MAAGRMIFCKTMSGQNGCVPWTRGLANIQSLGCRYLLLSFQGQRSAATRNSNEMGAPPALPGRQSNFENSGSIPPAVAFVFAEALPREPRAVAVAFALHRLRSGPFEGPATVKPPALPEDTYSWRRHKIKFKSTPTIR